MIEIPDILRGEEFSPMVFEEVRSSITTKNPFFTINTVSSMIAHLSRGVKDFLNTLPLP